MRSLEAIYSRAQERHNTYIRESIRVRELRHFGKLGRLVHTFIIAHVHSPLFVSAEVVNGCDDTLGVSFCGVLLNGFQHALPLLKKTILRLYVFASLS